MEIDSDGSTKVTFPSFDLRPRDVEDLDAFHLFARPELAGQVLEATWEATSTSADGVASGVLSIRVADEPLSLEQLLEEKPSEED